jgi:hypothetical protein
MDNVSKADFKAMLASAKLPEKTVQICLRGDLAAEHETAEKALEQAEKNALSADSLDGGGVGELADRLEALEAQMREHTYPFRLRALPKPKWRALVAEHQPRRDDDGEVLAADRFLGVNADTFFEAITKACVVDPEMDDDDWRVLLDEKLTDAQFDTLSEAAWGLNRRDVDVPFSRAASRLNRSSASE